MIAATALSPTPFTAVSPKPVLGVHDRRQERGHVLGGVVRLEIGGAVGEQGVTGRMGLVERVVAGGLTEPPQVGCDLRVGAAGDAAADELVLQGRHQHLVLLAHGLAQVIGARGREAGELTGDRHQLFLVHRDAVGGAGDRLQARVGELHQRRVALVLGVGGDERHRSRAVERDEGDQVGELGGADLAQGLAHPAGLELEHADGVAARQHPVGLEVVER
jgi:hypothetical protein